MAVTTRATWSGSFNVAALTNIPFTKPTGTVAGDLMIAALSANMAGTATVTPPAGGGWTQGGFDGSNTWVGTIFWYWKIAGAAEPATYNWQLSVAADGGIGIISLAGADQVNPIAGGSTSAGGASSTTATFASVSFPAQDVVALLVMGTAGDPATVFWPAGFNQSPDGFTANDTINWIFVASNLATQPGATSLPSRSATFTVTTWETFQVAIKVATAGGAAPGAQAAYAYGPN